MILITLVGLIMLAPWAIMRDSVLELIFYWWALVFQLNLLGVLIYLHKYSFYVFVTAHIFFTVLEI